MKGPTKYKLSTRNMLYIQRKDEMSQVQDVRFYSKKEWKFGPK